MELLRLRIKDMDVDRRRITVRQGKGHKDRVTVIPESLIELAKAHLVQVKALHQADLANGMGTVWLKDALDRKYPDSPKEWRWQWVFPLATLSKDPANGVWRRHQGVFHGLPIMGSRLHGVRPSVRFGISRQD